MNFVNPPRYQGLFLVLALQKQRRQARASKVLQSYRRERCNTYSIVQGQLHRATDVSEIMQDESKFSRKTS